MALFGGPDRWLIVKREGVWTICPPADKRRAGVNGGLFETGAAALSTFAACHPIPGCMERDHRCPSLCLACERVA
jgi:hypothetical protein